ncbi:type II toxin-antitoxin system PemK/MazF family toxin [Nitratifractor sp.]|uniref:type II toxin-antitoxin system PemK/MazF family toxin n=1 Tax=Nitratifractor sp. TaxID=2268144 RepID=UPI0025FD259F|nr:type II toxin-antitoxin system PemK/MazF family toxin [Nitratifractor sp.]
MGKLRPAIILSDEQSNEILETVIVIPLSTVIEPETFPFRWMVKKRERLEKNSDACINEIRSLSKKRVKEYLAVLTEEELAMIQEGLCRLIR